MATYLTIAIFSPFLFVPLLAMAGRALRERTGWLALAAPVLSATLILLAFQEHPAGTRTTFALPWIPSLGLNLTFMTDGLSLFFGLVVSGMGVLVFFYAQQYLDAHYKHHGRFYAYLALFMGAMLGTVFAGNLLLLFVFWELTGIASFLLIGFLHEKEVSRAGARMALLITGGTGLAMLAGVVLVGVSAGTYDLAVLLSAPLYGGIKDHANLAFVLMAVGALGKSAQFPFHFWLPNAMAAPTPVSAYLHSATMVKLGVFLIGRIFPMFREAELWVPLLMVLCFGTMLLGALLALWSHDLKAILAYSTVSQLGFLIGYYGVASPEGVRGDLLHIANHVFYKGCLFMVVGIIDHSTQVRDVRKLGGLRRHLPLLTVIAIVAASAMAGLPGTTGFISKEYLLKEQWDYWAGEGFLAWYPLAMVVSASILNVAFSARIIHGVFFGKESNQAMEHFHAPGLLLQLPPAILASACLIFGLATVPFGQRLQAFWTPGLHADSVYHLTLWHGVTREFLTSVAIVLVGVGVYAAMRSPRWPFREIPRLLRFDLAFEAAVHALPYGAKALSRGLRADHPFDYVPIVLGTFLALAGGYYVYHHDGLLPALPTAGDFDPLRSFVVVLIGAAVVLVVGLRRWTGQLIALSIVGFLVTFYYVLFRAPDLAMTQILVESATLLLILLLLARFPRSAEIGEEARRGARGLRKVVNVFLAGAIGVFTTALTLMALSPRSVQPAGDYYLEATVPLAYGTNAVNTILVDFRGFDTLLEITVLLIATLGAIGLLMRYRRTPEEYAQGPHGPAGFGIGEDTPEAERKEKS